MERIGPWFSAAIEHFKRHGRHHVVPAVGMLVFILGSTAGMMVLIGGVAAVGAYLGEEWVVLGGVLLMFPLIFLMIAAMMPLMVGYHRAVLTLQRGEPYEPRVLLSGMGQLPSILLASFLTIAATMVGSLFCYLPGLLLGVLFAMTFPAMADDPELGAIGAIKTSIRLVKPHLLTVFVFWMATTMLMTVLAYIPLVGPMASFPVMTVLTAVCYEDLKKLDAGAVA